MSLKPKGLLGDMKIANVLHHPGQAKFIPCIYILFYQSNIQGA